MSNRRKLSFILLNHIGSQEIVFMLLLGVWYINHYLTVKIQEVQFVTVRTRLFAKRKSQRNASVQMASRTKMVYASILISVLKKMLVVKMR